MDKREAGQILGMVNSYHFEANPDPVTEEQLAYYREERDKRIAMLKAEGFEVELLTGESLESCGRYALKEEDSNG